MTKRFDRQNLKDYADWLAIAVAVALPWSSSATSVLIVLWLVTLIGSWNIAERIREQWTVGRALPMALWALGVAGMLWAAVPWAERIAGLSGFHKLLAIPLFALQFRDSHRGLWVLIAFLASCTVMLVVSWGLILLPDLHWRGRQRSVGAPMMIGIPVKDYTAQATFFTLCVLGLAEGAFISWYNGQRRFALALAALAIAFFTNIFYAAISRTALVALPVLFALLALRRFGWRGAVGLASAATIFLAVAWTTSPPLRGRVLGLFDEMRNYQPSAASTPAGERLEFWRKSIIFIVDAPVIGHGTGSIREQFRQSAVGHTGMAALELTNPHNQILAIAIQLGLIGTLMFLAMWVTHLRYFSTGDLAGGIGLAVVVQNIVSSQFNSSLLDATSGWIYVIGVGVLNGMGMRAALLARDEGRKLTFENGAGRAFEDRTR